ncbi:huntingtin-interacting protein M [Pipistrellus kuhlii]|uniref:Uncharacterized protein n=1 Tax=Pipistrellus kuhlii TaxID=59472 RepID=A0A7J7V652_PIPKU|nr:huntingtin-interacting protein M [Pipistrellus kuhlii]KAF6320538.1 hypothetical protein mPipKuh1_006468 [Pipistrellus kuhlii]
MSQNQSPENSSKTPDHLITAEWQSPLSYVDRLLQNNHPNQDQSSRTDDLVMVMLDTLTDYIVEMVGMEANNESVSTIQHPAQGAANGNGEPHGSDAAFTLFDQKRGSRRG